MLWAFVQEFSSRWQSRNTFGYLLCSAFSLAGFAPAWPAVVPSQCGLPLVEAVCELGEAGISGNPSYSVVNGG